jgi:hypothetical protein
MKNHPSIPSARATLSQQLGLAPAGKMSYLLATDRAAHEEIQHRAYTHWQQEGYPPHRQLDHWLAAELEIVGPPRETRANVFE